MAASSFLKVEIPFRSDFTMATDCDTLGSVTCFVDLHISGIEKAERNVLPVLNNLLEVKEKA